MTDEPMTPYILRDSATGEGVVAYVIDPAKKADGGVLYVVGQKWPPLFPILRARLWALAHGYGWLKVWKVCTP